MQFIIKKKKDRIKVGSEPALKKRVGKSRRNKESCLGPHELFVLFGLDLLKMINTQTRAQYELALTFSLLVQVENKRGYFKHQFWMFLPSKNIYKI